MLRAQWVAPTSRVSPSELTCTAFASFTTRTLRPRVGPNFSTSGSGVSESSSPPMISTGTDDGRGLERGGTGGALWAGLGQSRQAW